MSLLVYTRITHSRQSCNIYISRPCLWRLWTTCMLTLLFCFHHQLTQAEHCLESGGASTSHQPPRQLHWLPVRSRVDFKISTLVYRSLAGTARVPSWLPPLAAVLCSLLTIERAWSRGHATSSVTAVLPPLGQRCGTVCLNSFGNRTSPSDNSNDRWKRLCLVSWAAAPCVWTLRALTRNLLLTFRTERRLQTPRTQRFTKPL